MTIKKTVILGIIFCRFVFTPCMGNNFKDAVVVWHLSNSNDSRLTAHGDVQFVSLNGKDAKASKKRGGDGIAARFNGGTWFDAGQGTNDELNLTGKNVSILVRMKADTVKGFTPLISKAGNDQNIAYRISLNVRGGDVYIETMMGSDDIAGAHLLKYKIPEEEVTQWHDIVLRFNGKISELFVNGVLRDDEVTAGDIRDWNRRPVLIGAQYKQPYGYADFEEGQVEAVFEGLIDHIALWNKCLTDKEVMKLSGVTGLIDGKPEYYTEKYRPQFHFSAKKNWLNDPNGLVYYDGVYHLFFQYHPPHRPGAYKDWGHAISTDLVHWEQIPHHITPHKVWAGCWSGSAVVDVNNVAGFQTGKEKAIIAFITMGGDSRSGIGPLATQCIAYSTDGGTTFTYYDQNPVIRNICGSNRDPKVVWDEMSQKWIMSLFMGGNDFSFFSSSDFKEWKQLSTTSLSGDAECPGFEALPLDGDATNKKWLLFGAKGDYMIGSFDGTNFKPETEVIRGDHGNSYFAGMTWNNAPDGRCIKIAFMPTKRFPGMPFEQQMTIPTEVSLRTTPEGMKVFKMPVPEIRNLYEKEHQWQNENIKDNNIFKDLNGDLYDFEIEVDVNPSSSFEIGLRNITLYYDAGKKILSCGGKPPIEVEGAWARRNRPNKNSTNNLGEAPLSPIDGKVKLRILLDRTSIEIFGNDGQIVITSAFIPDDDNKTYSFTSNDGVKLVNAKVYSLKSAWTKPLKP